ncbi:type III PLP-dependent enzyme [Magnetospirillum molischianum]|uniref:ornithine decarboxylase n=1 Tax=Magnetospirillum molischianum DSM 120 TaxID=1150626 RepID=H8FMJ6_MAGML|nr:type III PLP-dependent enzyme [Magnetospirillum molischianum]CCG39584.1 putative ornithine decarboxylase [Magnetospirillum molischianum DSM 120]
MTAKIARFLEEVRPVTPCVVVDLDVVRDNYLGLRRWLPLADVYYAVKANPAPEIVRMLTALGSNFDVASRGEIDLCLSSGVSAENISFGNTIKKQRDIAYAYEKGVRLYAFDCEAELEKLAEAAPGSRVFCRILMTCDGAEWPLSRKFGCEIDMARDLLVRARDLGLDPYGVSFHVGSQQTDLSQWDIAVGKAAMLFTALDAVGVELRMVNLGGGFPARYRSDIPAVERYADAVMSAMTNHFGNNIPAMIIEPGRSLVGDAGILETEVVLISRKGYDEDVRWVYLDVGKFGGLAETMDEAIKYRILTTRDGDDTAPVVLAGPTCDSADILYEKSNYEMPVSLKVGDKVRILSTGAYTTSYSAVNFNGFDPLKAYFI